jgi:hypothetical protein
VRRHLRSERAGPSLSTILTQIAADESRQRVCVGDIMAALHDRAIGAMILVFALPNVVPRLLRPRLQTLARPPFEYLVGAICLLLSIILFLPIPMGNIPPAIAICLFALAILERDGVWVLAGLCVSAAAVVIVWGVLFALLQSALFLISRWLG